MPKGSLNVSLKGADDIFSTEESRQEQQREQVQQIPIGELFPFKNHPFKVLDDESMQRTVESVEQYGVLSPLIARPRPEGGYEIISGHRRQHAAQLAGLDALPVIVRKMDDDAAVLLMVDSNLQRENISHERVSQQLADIAGKLVADYWDNNSEDIRAIVDGSFLMDYDSAGLEMQFKSAAAISVTYALLERCGFEPDGYFDKDSFQAIYDFSTPDTVYALGAAVSDISREVLRTVERAVKTTIRRRNNERSQHEYEQQSELHADRGLSSPEPDPASAEDPAGQVRQDAPELSEATAPGAVQHDAPEREPVPDPDRTGADRSSNEGTDDGRSAGEEPGSGQGEESDGVGTAHEQPTGAGRGSDSDGTDLQLSFLDAVIPTEAQQIEHPASFFARFPAE